MDKFKRADLVPLSEEQRQEYMRWAEAMGLSAVDVDNAIAKAMTDEVYVNDTYQVNVRRYEDLIHLSIKRRDKEAAKDWRHFQQIKNEILGPEYEAAELYPAESRLVDTANQYHLWALPEAGQRFPFGFNARVVDDSDYNTGAKQRKFTNDLND